MLGPTVDTVRVFVHLLAASVWVGGQIVLAGVVPALRPVGSEATRAAANGFARVAWPAYVVVFATGIWNLIAQDGSVSAAYNATLGVKVLLFAVAGGAAFAHGRTGSRTMRAATGALGAGLALVVMFLGVLLTRHT